jgi:hypothetical protein
VLTLEELTAAAQRGEPFILRTTSGKEHAVNEPEKLVFSSEGNYLIILPRNEPPSVVLLENISEIVF